jgi:hypothetical protein
MALNNALTLLTQGMTRDQLIDSISAPTFWAAVHETASDYRVSRLLELGKLAACSGAQRRSPPLRPSQKNRKQ